MSSRPASIAAITLIQAALLVALIWTGLYWLNATNLQQLGQRARISAQMLAMSVAVPLLADEPVRLDELIAASGLDADLPHARVLDVEGVLLASRGDGDARRVGATPIASARRVCRFPVNPDHVDGAAPIIVGAQVLGRVEVGLATAGLDALLCKAFWIALVLAALQILLVAGFLRLLARRRGRELVQLQRAAEHDANAAKSRFLASMSHELRTPLNAILNLNELLLESGLDDEQRGYAVTASESACALLSIVNGVLDFSKIEAARVELAPRPSDPEEIVKSVIDLLAARAYAKEVPLVVYCDPSVPLQLRTDPGLVRQILLNLIGNAIKFTDQGAVRVHLVLSPAADALRIEVIDTGIGIAEDKQLNLFKEFVQADAADNRKYGGSGLGLVISRRLAHLLGGEIELRSALGEGSCFALVLPLPEAVDADSDLRAKAAAPLLDWYLTLWVDNAWVAEDLASQLAILGLDVEIVPPTAAAVGIGCCGEILLEPKPGGEAARRGDRPRRVALYQLGSHCPTNLGDPGRAIAALRIPVVASELIGRLLQAATATSPIPDTHASDDLAKRVARCAASALPVLLAEDSRANQLVVTSILGKAGFRVDVAENGLQAVAAVNRRDYALVLMDIAMPEMDGLEATGCIRALPGKRGQVPIVAMTANAFAEDGQRCLDAGMDDYLTKPVERRALFEAMLRWLGGEGKAPRPMPASEALPKRIDTESVFVDACNPSSMARKPATTRALASRPTATIVSSLTGDGRDDRHDDATDDGAIMVTTLANDVGNDCPLDEAVIATLASDLSDELMPAVVATFIEEAEQRISAIEQAAALGDAAQAGEEGHALKGSAATFGAWHLREIAFAVEVAGRAGSLAAVHAQLDGLRSQGRLAIKALRVRYCGGVSAEC